MKHLYMMLVFCFVAASGVAQEPGASCTALHFTHASLCTASDGSGARYDYDSGTLQETRYDDPGKWSAYYLAEMKIDTEYLDSLSKMTHDQEARGIDTKKQCEAEGFRWHKATWRPFKTAFCSPS